MNQDRHHRRIRRLITAVAALGCAAVSVCIATWSGCTATPENYELLSFFFDGVPDPSAPVTVAGLPAGVDDIRRSPTYTIHQPYADEQCSDCHASRFRMSRDDAGPCIKCHEDQLSTHSRMHGPVVAGACLWCHAPHESAHVHLLRDPGRTMCTQCHVQELLSAERVPEHADETRSCLECHYGHGGDTAGFLRSQAQGAPGE